MPAPTDSPLPDPLPIEPLAEGHAFDARVTPPCSKSITNRAMLIAALASGRSVLRGALTDANDARVMLRALQQLGVGVEVDGTTVTIDGAGGTLRGGVELHLGNAGTATRFLTAASALAEGDVLIDGDPRMRERPIGELLDFLRALGVDARETMEKGFPPVRIRGAGRVEGGTVRVPRTLSSQYVSALIMLAPHTENGISIRFTGEVTSAPYIEMTLGLLEKTIGYAHEGSIECGELRLPPLKRVEGFELDIEPDASGATYFFAASAMVPGARATVPIRARASLQSDAGFAWALERMGAVVRESDGGTTVEGPAALKGVEIDFKDMPDAAMTLASVACFADGPTTIHGLRTLRVKETDRLRALVNELSKIGATVEILQIDGDESLRVTPPADPCSGEPVVFETYDDHRMAMALALIGLRRPGVSIADPGCVGKTYPGFWADLASLR